MDIRLSGNNEVTIVIATVNAGNRYGCNLCL